MTRIDLSLWSMTSVKIGTGLWLLLVFARLFNLFFLDDLSLLLLLAVAVITPLAIPLAAHSNPSVPKVYRLVVLGQPVAAICAAISLVLSVGWVAGLLAGVWQLFTILVALFGALLLYNNHERRMDD